MGRQSGHPLGWCRPQMWWVALALLQTFCYAAVAQRYPVTRNDIAAAFPIDDAHTTVAKAGRAWRKGIRTVIATNSTPSQADHTDSQRHGEVWTMYPDDNPLRALYPGDTRAALAPFIAHKLLGDTYKWMLYGDDDTFFFVEGVLDMVQDLDPDMPYFITDHMWWSPQPNAPMHPRNDAPRCLPCNFDENQPGIDPTKAPYQARKGCPCTPKDICTLPEYEHVFRGGCDIPRHPKWTYSMHGGAGAVISVGLLRRVSLAYMEECIQGDHSTGGDAFISICLWKAGYGTTDPGFSFYHPEIQMFDPGPEDRMGVLMRLSRALERKCDDSCALMLQKMVSLHIRSRHFPTLEHAGMFMRALAAMYDGYSAMRAADGVLAAAGQVQAA